ncbi:MAG: FKBP-type peptidyl-prolyl cis-trans isomerase [Lachnospiraceae bacterium]|nr:FKBP-type peptidyl-prolyl cis-trans isomerase [Lachnospiraceae bacterium]
MKMENKRQAQQRRADERKKQERLALLKKILIPVLVIGAIVAFIGYGMYDEKHNGDASEETASDANTQTTNTTDGVNSVDTGSQDLLTNQSTLNTDTSLEVQDGDLTNIHYVGSVDGVEFQGGTGDYDLEIGSGDFIPGFEEQLIGAHVGDTVDVNVTFPEGYSDSSDAEGNVMHLSGADAVFTVTINGIYK